jgi:hypothetical protein
VLALFKRYKEKAHGEYVVESSGGLSKPEANYAHYRCEPVFNRLASWLRAHGVSNAKPLHTLRKEYGSALARTLGILAASHGLRHDNRTQENLLVLCVTGKSAESVGPKTKGQAKKI